MTQRKSKNAGENKDVKLIPPIPQDMVDIFNVLAKSAYATADEFARQQDNPELAQRYTRFHRLAEIARSNSEKYLKLVLTEMPTLIENDFLAGIIRLAQYCTRAGKDLHTGAPLNTPITLGGFMELFCTPLLPKLRRSRRESLLSAAHRGKITLPPVEGNWKSGQSKKYRPIALMRNWPKYREYLPNLPELKPPQAAQKAR